MNFAIVFVLYVVHGFLTVEGCDSALICVFNAYAYVTADKSHYTPITITDCDYSGCDFLLTDGPFFNTDAGSLDFSDYSSDTAEGLTAALEEYVKLPFNKKLIYYGAMCFGSVESYDNFIASLQDTRLPQAICDYLTTNNLQGVVLIDETEGADIFQSFLKSLHDLLKEKNLLVYVLLGYPEIPMADTYIKNCVTYSSNCDMILMRGCNPYISQPNNLMDFQFIKPIGQESGEQCQGDSCAIDSIVQQLTNAGVDIKKLAIPVKADCLLAALDDGSSNCIGASITYGDGNGAVGPVWGSYFAWFDEVCMIEKNPLGGAAIFSCTDRPLAAQITQYACDKSAGGIYLDSINYDDSGSLCNCGGPYPLKSTIVSVKTGTDPASVTPCLDSSKIPPVEQKCCPAPSR